MKKIFTKAMLVAAAAMAFFACQKPEVIAPEEVNVEGLIFSAVKPEFADASKTEWTGSEIRWSKGDAIRVAYTCDGVWQNADGTATASEENGKKTAKLYASAQLSEASATAKFAVPGNFKGTAEGIYEFYAVYPSGAAVKNADFPFAPSVTVDIPVEQTPLANSFDSAADIMAAKSVETFEGLPKEEISLLWTRIVAHGHLTLKNLQVEDGEKLQTITLTADKDADMVGEHYLYLDTHNVEKAAGNNAANSLTVKADNLTIAEGGNVTFWTCFLPCTWKSVNVVVETDKATYTREIDLSANQKTFAQNARNTLSINMSSAVREVKSSNALPFVKDFSDNKGTDEITALEGFSSIGGKVYNVAGAIRLASGNSDGSITTQLLDLSQNFHVKVTASGWDDNELSLIISTSEPVHTETVDLTAFGGGDDFAEHIINFQPVSNSASVTFTAKKDVRCYIKKIEILEGHAELTPVLSATNPDEMSAEGGEGSFTYTLSNPKDGKTVSATKNVDWIENLAVNQETKTVSYNVAENTSEESRTATITLSYEGAQSVNVTVTQKGKAAEGDTTPKFVKVTTAPADWSGTYLIVCETQNVVFNGSLTTLDATNNTVSVTIQNGEIAYSDALNSSTFVVAKNGEASYTIQSASGYYIGRDATSNGLNANTSTKYVNTIILNSGNITITGKGGLNLRYNKNSDQKRFRYYTSAQTEIQLYKLVGGESGGETPEPEPEQLEMSAITCSAQTENSLTFTWTAVADATGYEVTCNNKTETVTATQYVATNLAASTSYTISVVAKGNGADYLDSQPKTQTGTTKETQSSVTLSVDFENTSYAEWTVSNLQLKQSGAITPKGGSYYGTTGGKTTASITTNDVYASPNSITCYVSKTSTNTNADSKWNIQVSSNGSTWTTVKTQSASSMTKGNWVELTADLSSYSNVYVRVAYSGTTAVRAIDNLIFTYTN